LLSLPISNSLYVWYRALFPGVDMTTEQKLMAWKRDVDQNLYSLTDQAQIHSNHNQSTTASALVRGFARFIT
jgi:hypothetical protein